MGADAEGVELPHGQHAPSAEATSEAQAGVAGKNEQEQGKAEQCATSAPQPEPNTASEAPPPRSETPSTQDQPSEDAVSTSPTTPSSLQPSQATPTTTRSTLPTVPAVPVIPALPKTAPKQAKPTTTTAAEKSSADVKTAAPGDGQVESGKTPVSGVNGTAGVTVDAVQPAPAPSKPKLWTGLFAKPASAASSSAAATATQVHTNGDAAAGFSSVPSVAGSFAKTNASSLTEALQTYRPGAPEKLPFLEPRGLVNTGNMCYMNSVRVRRHAEPCPFLIDFV